MQVAADCSGVRGVRQKATDSESVSGSSSTLSRSSSRGEAAFCPIGSKISPSRVLQRLQQYCLLPHPLRNPRPTTFRRRSFPSFESFTILLLHLHLNLPCKVSLTFSNRAAILISLTRLVPEGAIVRVVEEDDGSGWVKVADEGGGRGLVPASYIEAPDAIPAPKAGAGQSVGSGQFGGCRTPWLI